MRYETLLRQAFLRGSICSSGDLTCQYFKGGEKIDPYRAIGFFGYGFFSSPIIYKTFYICKNTHQDQFYQII